MNILKPDLCVIGAGSGGLSIAAGAVQMGATVVLIEKGEMGGDCLNYGCVPSKAIIAAARKANQFRTAAAFGVADTKPNIDYAKVAQHIQQVIATIAPNDSVERFEKLGVNVLSGSGYFVDPKTVQVGEQQIQARRFVIATGSSAAIPPIPGLQQTPFYTNETIFSLTEQPEHLIIVGGGPIGCELAQAHLLLGTKVSLLEGASIMAKDDPEAVQIVRDNLCSQGLHLFEAVSIQKIEHDGEQIKLTIEQEGKQEIINGSHLLIAAGRTANLQTLQLEQAGIKYTARGVDVDARLRTSNKKVFAIGDVAGSFQFTHSASYHAGIVIRNALFHLPAKVNYQAMPWVTYTTPELAQVGLNEPMAQQQSLDFQTVCWPFTENDRAITELDTDGFIKVLVDKKGRILGATIVGPEAGELISIWGLAINNKLRIKHMAELIIPYPTLSEVSKRVAGKHFLPLITSVKMKRIVKFLQKF